MNKLNETRNSRHQKVPNCNHETNIRTHITNKQKFPSANNHINIQDSASKTIQPK